MTMQNGKSINVQVFTGDRHKASILPGHVGRNGYANYGGLRFAQLHNREHTTIDQLRTNGIGLRGGSVVPTEDLDDICRQWLEARGYQVLAPGQEVHVLVDEFGAIAQGARVFLDEAQAKAKFDRIRAGLLQDEPLTDENWDAYLCSSDKEIVYLFVTEPEKPEVADAQHP
jgi:hypothetical protein